MKLALVAPAIALMISVSAHAQGEVKSAEQVGRDLFTAIEASDVDAMMADYADDAVTIVGDMAVVGKPAIRARLETNFGPGAGTKTDFTVTGVTTVDGVGFVKWTTSGGMTGQDVLVVREGKIAFQVIDVEPAAN